MHSRFQKSRLILPNIGIRGKNLALAMSLIAICGVGTTNVQGQGAASSNESDSSQVVWDKTHARAFYPAGESSEQWSEIYTTAVYPRQRTANSTAKIQVKIRFHDPQANEVTLVWGLNSFARAPKSLPENTVLTYNRSHMNTLMNFDDNVFTVDLEVPENTRLDYAFTINRDVNNKKVNIWRGGQNQGYHTTMLSVANADEVLEPSSSFPIKDYVLMATSFGVTAFFMIRLAWYVLHNSGDK